MGVLVWLGAWAFAGAFYWLLIDSTDSPELVAGSVAAALAATGFLLARGGEAKGAPRPRLLRRALTPLLRAPRDILVVSWMALRALPRRDARVGEFRAAPFARGPRATQTARQALAEALGSLAPNTIVVGIDAERELILAHQLRRSGGRSAVDPLELG